MIASSYKAFRSCGRVPNTGWRRRKARPPRRRNSSGSRARVRKGYTDFFREVERTMNSPMAGQAELPEYTEIDRILSEEIFTASS